jgi:hypothetical protein
MILDKGTFETLLKLQLRLSKYFTILVFSSFQLQLQEEAGAFQNHVQSFFTADQRSRSQPRPEKPERRNEADDDRRSRAVTPGVNFTKVLRAAFTREDPKSLKH